MSLVTKAEACDFLGVPDTLPGLQAAIDDAEMDVASQFGVQGIESATYSESIQLDRFQQQIYLRNGPATNLSVFTIDDVDYLADVQLTSTGWAIDWQDFGDVDTRGRTKGFEPESTIAFDYTAGWTDKTLPQAVRYYILARTGLSLYGVLAAGINDAKLGDLTVKIQRETLSEDLARYERYLAQFKRGF